MNLAYCVLSVVCCVSAAINIDISLSLLLVILSLVTCCLHKIFDIKLTLNEWSHCAQKTVDLLGACFPRLPDFWGKMHFIQVG